MSAPDPAGFDPEALAHAVRFAMNHGTDWCHDLRAVIESGTFDPPPWNKVLGPTPPRGEPSGIILSKGRVAAAWGDVHRADMAFSVTKSYLGILAGVAVDRGPNRRHPRASTAHGIGAGAGGDVQPGHLLAAFAAANQRVGNRALGYPRHGRSQTGKLSPIEDGSRFGAAHAVQPPGTYWDYNDVRVNFLCLCLTRLFGRSLADVLGEAILGPLGAAPGWQWWGLHGRTVAVGDEAVPCVVGGGHWGGGLVTSACHDARMGLLVARGGVWRGQQVVSRTWLDTMLRPCPLNPIYGALWWLNTDRALHAAASPESVFAFGVGMNAIWVDRARDAVVVTRWIDRSAFPEFVTLIAASQLT